MARDIGKLVYTVYIEIKYKRYKKCNLVSFASANSSQFYF